MSGQFALGIPLRERAEGWYELIDAQQARRILAARLRRRYQFPEMRWLHWHLSEAIDAYAGLSAAKIMLRNVVTGSSFGDGELFPKAPRRASRKTL